MPDSAKIWLSAGEIAKLQIATLPKTRRAIVDKAKRDGWQSQIRRDQGGGAEYKIPAIYKGGCDVAPSDTPLNPPANYHLKGRVQNQEGGSGKALPPADRGSNMGNPSPTIATLPKSIDRGIARADIANAFNAYLLAHKIGVMAGIDAFVDDFNSGKITGDFAFTNISRASVLRWRKAVNIGDFKSLAGKFGNRKGTSIIDANRDLQTQIIAHFTRTRLAGKTIHQLLLAKGFQEIPSTRQIANWFNAWARKNPADALKLRNPDKARSKYALSLGEMYAHLTRPNELWEIDASPADVICDDGRYNIYVIADMYARRLLVEITDSPSTHGSLRLIRRAINEWGMPERLRTDNGSDFTSKWFKHAMFKTGINIDLTNPYSPHEKGGIERAIGTINDTFMRLNPGYAGHNVTEKTEIENRQSFAYRNARANGEKIDRFSKVKLTRDELARRASNWVAEDYYQGFHKGIGCSPAERLANYTGEIKTLEDPTIMHYLFAKLAGGDGTRVIGKKGIRADRHYFIAHEIDLYMGHTVQVAMDLEDMGQIYVSGVENGEYLFTAYNAELEGINRMAVAHIAKATKRAHNKEIKREIAHAAKQIDNDDFYKILENFKHAQRREHAIKHGFIEGEIPPNNLHVLPRKSQKISNRTIAPELASEQKSAENSTANVVQIAPTPATLFQRSKALEKTIANGELINIEDAQWLKIYQQSPNYRSFKMMEETFGQEYLLETHG